MTADRIVLTGLRGRGRHGWFAFETEQGQDFLVDLELTVDLTAAGASDDLADTVDYGTIAARVVDLVEGEPVRLIERLGQQIATTCLEDRRVREVLVTVHKPEAPVPVPFSDVAIQIRRSQP